MNIRQSLNRLVYDTIGYNPGTSIIAGTQVPLFSSVDKPSKYRNLQIAALTKDVKHVLQSMILRTNFQSADADKPVEELKRFFDNSYLFMKRYNTDYPEVPLSSLLPYSLWNNGSTTELFPKNKDVVMLLNEIELVTDVSMYLVLDELTLPAAAANKHSTLTGLTSTNTGFYMRLDFGAFYDRPALG